jgi:hypothetical protein
MANRITPARRVAIWRFRSRRLTAPAPKPDNTTMKLQWLMAGLGVLVWILPAAAQQRPSAEVQRLGEFIRSPDHLTQVKAAIAAFEPATLAARCADVRPIKGRAWQPVEEPVFDPGATAPKNGAWQETWEITACGQPGVRSVGFVARPGQGIVPLPMFPGESLANLRLQHDAGQLALTSTAPGALQCNSRMQIVSSSVTNRADHARGRWSERWTVAGCDRTAEIDVDFTPGPQGQPSFEFRNRASR